jgi:hypothetical protein
MEFGIDLSHHQISEKLAWNELEGKVKFVICRAAYGGVLRDRQVVSQQVNEGTTVGDIMEIIAAESAAESDSTAGTSAAKAEVTA